MLVWLWACAEEPAAPPPAAGPTPAGTLSWVAESESGVETWAAPAAGGEPRRVAAGAFPAAADPRGEAHLLVAVDGAGEGHSEWLALAPVAGGEPVPLPLRAAFVRNPAWTPDGTAVVVESSALSFRDLFRVPRDGGPVARLTDAPGGSFDPTVSPDGALVYASSRSGDLELWRQPLAGGAAERLTEAGGEDRRPAFRPDGGRVAWLASREGHARVWMSESSGAGAQPLRDGASGDDLEFAWSPDGTRLAVVEQLAPDRLDLVVVDAVRRRELVRLSGGVNENPAWSPDGAWVAWSSTRSGDREVWLARADGRDARAFTARPGPDWLPRRGGATAAR